MVADVDVANAAIRLVGGTRITSFTDGSKNANVVNDLYEEVRDELLRSHIWNFAKKFSALARSATAPAFRFSYAYPLPSDWIRTETAHDNDAGAGTFLHEEAQVGGQHCIVTDAENVYLSYVSRVEDTNLMTPDFRTALAFALARAIAIPIASSNTLEDQLEKRAKAARVKAMSTDSMGGTPRQRPRGSWASVRSQGWPTNRWPLS